MRRVLYWTLPVGLMLLVTLFGLAWYFEGRCAALDCVFYRGSAGVQCASGASRHEIQRLPISDSSELYLENVEVIREGATAKINVKLKGSFWNDSDQNIYAFIGRPSTEGTGASYSLSSDTQYFSDLSYPVRHAIQLSHSLDIRVGIMAPTQSQYTPQVYITDPVRADLVGSTSHVGVEVDEHVVRIQLPLDEFYGRRGTAVPPQINVTIATARDYVGFVDQITAPAVAIGETKAENRISVAPAVYPHLDYNSHIVKNLRLEQADGGLKVSLEMEQPIEDWAQTNLYFFFVPYPSDNLAAGLRDPSRRLYLPHAWSFYCGVYSPNRIVARTSNGTDFSYDVGYAERSTLEAPEGVRFRALGGATYSLELSPETVEKLMSGKSGFSLLLTAGRDGFGPTSCYGWNCSGVCNVVLSIKDIFNRKGGSGN